MRAPFICPSAAATSAAVRIWCAASSSSRRATGVTARRITCTAWRVPVRAPIAARRAFRAASDVATNVARRRASGAARHNTAGHSDPHDDNPLAHMATVASG